MASGRCEPAGSSFTGRFTPAARLALLFLKESCLNVSLLITCLGDALFPQVGVATVRLLRRLGVTVDFPSAQTCCGQPHFNSGYHDEARLLARHTIEAFAGSAMVVTPSGSCAAMVKLEYPELFHD